MSETINLMSIKQALLDPQFRQKLPSSLSNEVVKFLQNPNCPCNHPIYVKVAKVAGNLLQEYFPNKRIEIKEPAYKNNWSVFNCSIHELESKLKTLGPGRKQVEVARYQDQVTVVVNDLDQY